MEASPNNKKLWNLVEQAEERLLVLPEFQRDFVWPRKNIESLLDSLLRGHYVGSLLFLETDLEHMPFGYRDIEGLSKSPNGARVPEDLVLDGQQRLTALYYAHAAPELALGRGGKFAYRFYLNLDKVENLEEVDDAIWSERADRPVAKRLQEPKIQYKEKTLPFTEVLQWDDWKQGYLEWLYEQGDQEALREYIKGEQRRWDEAVRRIRDAEVPVVTLDKVSGEDRKEIRQICDIFEKLNSTGLKLTVFDLMTARLNRYDIKLRGTSDEPGLWEQALQEYPLLRQYAGGEPDMQEADPEDFGIMLLQTVALLRDQEVRSKKMIELDHEGFGDDWRRAASALENALKKCTNMGPDGFGIFDSKWVPSRAILVVLAALTARLQEGEDAPSAPRALRRWYWSSVFSDRYARSADSIMYQDFQDMAKFMVRGDVIPSALSVAQAKIIENPQFSLRDVSRSSSTAYKGVITLVALEGAKDFANNNNITFQGLDDHHIFPKNYLKKTLGVVGDNANTVVNRTLLASSTNRKIQDKSPSNYLRSVLPKEHRESILDSHFMNADARAAMFRDDYEAFLVARERALISKIKEVVS